MLSCFAAFANISCFNHAISYGLATLVSELSMNLV